MALDKDVILARIVVMLMMNILVVHEILLQYQNDFRYLIFKRQFMLLIYLFYDRIALIFVKIAMFMFNSILLSIVQLSKYNSCIISIMATVEAIRACTANRIAMIAIKLFEFNLINVNLAVYDVITSLVSNIFNIFHVSQILYAEKFNVLFCLLIESLIIVYCVAYRIIDIVHNFAFIHYVPVVMDVNLSTIACSLAILIVIVLVDVKNDLICYIDANFNTYDVTSCYTSCTIIYKTNRIVSIALEFDVVTQLSLLELFLFPDIAKVK